VIFLGGVKLENHSLFKTHQRVQLKLPPFAVIVSRKDRKRNPQRRTIMNLKEKSK
jgi:hypothetical protein